MSLVHHLTESPSILDEYMMVLRDVSLQDNRERFRENLKKIGRVMGYELSKGLSFQKKRIQTPLEHHEQRCLNDEVVVITILRAGLPLHEGILDSLPDAENGFISAYRKHHEGGFEIEVEYVACPSLEGKVVVINDPMLATGQSLVASWEALLDYGRPKEVHLASVIASQEGVDFVKNNAPSDYTLWVVDIDPLLNDQKYIVPGLGDAGDLSFGTKLQG